MNRFLDLNRRNDLYREIYSKGQQFGLSPEYADYLGLGVSMTAPLIPMMMFGPYYGSLAELARSGLYNLSKYRYNTDQDYLMNKYPDYME